MCSILSFLLLLSSARGSGFVDKDMSEYCRRRAAPSVFLARQAPEANAHVMSFSRLAGPYSCFITVRTEPGSSMILVVQTEHLPSSCRSHPDQLLVYEATPAQGGYWAAMTDAYLQQENAYPTPSEFYTLRTTPWLPATQEYSAEESEDSDTTTESTSDRDQSGLLVDHLPGIVDASKSKYQAEEAEDQYFDMLIDVTPRPGEKYDTSIIPLVHIVAHTGNGTDSYDLEYNVAKVSKLTTKKSKLSTKYHADRYNLRRFKTRMPFKNNNGTMYSKTKHTTKGLSDTVKTTLKKLVDNKINKSESYVNKTEVFLRLLDHIESRKQNTNIYLNDFSGFSPGLDENNVTYSESSNYIVSNADNDTIYNSPFTKPLISSTPEINITTEEITHISKEDIKKDDIVKSITNSYKYDRDSGGAITQTISNAPSLATYDPALDENNIRRHLEKLKKISYIDLSLPHHDSYYFDNTTKVKEIPTTENALTSNSNALNYSALFKPMTTNSSITTVDHQSWENVVQAASEIASSLHHTLKPKKKPHRAPVIRKKRRIDTISLNDAIPHRLITTTRRHKHRRQDVKFKNIRNFDSLLEPDNYYVLSGRHPPPLVPPSSRLRFNACDPTWRRVLVINTDRIVLAINNFTMERLTVIVTNAQQLSDDEEQCAESQLECQVTGARVCVDSASACDGVPNCGAPHIYDEDRTRCDTPSQHQGNAFTSITVAAVLATVIYIVNYWLKRCVPKVSDAYFVYTAGVENVCVLVGYGLHLESVMKSPRYVSDRTDSHENDTFFPPEDYDYVAPVPDKQTLLRKIINILLCKYLRSHERNNMSIEIDNTDQKHRYTFTELELRKISEKFHVDESVQTGASLEMAGPSVAATMMPPPAPSTQIQVSPHESMQHINTIQELKLIQMMKEARESRMEVSPASPGTLSSEQHEAEMQSAFYEPPSRSVTPRVAEAALPMKPSYYGKKRIRFDEHQYSMITTSSSVKGTANTKPSVILETGKKSREQLSIIEEHSEKPKTEKDVKRFWGNMKSKMKPPPRRH